MATNASLSTGGSSITTDPGTLADINWDDPFKLITAGDVLAANLVKATSTDPATPRKTSSLLASPVASSLASPMTSSAVLSSADDKPNTPRQLKIKRYQQPNKREDDDSKQMSTQIKLLQQDNMELRQENAALVVKANTKETERSRCSARLAQVEEKLILSETELNSYKIRYEEACNQIQELQKSTVKLQERYSSLEQENTRLRAACQAKDEKKYQEPVPAINIDIVMNKIDQIGQYRKKFYEQLSAYQRRIKSERDDIHRQMLSDMNVMIQDYQNQVKASEEAEMSQIKTNCQKFDQALCGLDEQLRKSLLSDN